MDETDTMPREVTITRVLDAPVDAAWRAWTDAEQLKQWFMPHGFSVPECTVDLRPGGALRMVILGPDGSKSTTDGEFLEVEPPTRCVFTSTAFDGALAVRNTVTFEDRGGTTELTLHAEVTKASKELRAALAGMEEGWLQTLEKLDALLTDTEVDRTSRSAIATRVLDAPRERVWRAYTDPEQLSKWWGLAGATIETHEIDVSPGGMWRATLHGPHGDFEQKMTYLTVQEPQVLAYLYGDPSEPGHAFTLVELADEGGKTTVTVTINFASAEERRRMVEEYGAQQGLEAALDALATYVAR
jgi:uncharacterized protein YndB with AHSA1/START domain